jgi:hypothetical protein
VDLQTVRDWVIIVYGIFGIITFLVITIVTAVIGVGVTRLLGAVNDLVDKKVAPAVESVKKTTDTVRGGASFIMDTAASPVIKTYGLVAGVRRGIGVLTGLTKRREE